MCSRRRRRGVEGGKPAAEVTSAAARIGGGLHAAAAVEVIVVIEMGVAAGPASCMRCCPRVGARRRAPSPPRAHCHWRRRYCARLGVRVAGAGASVRDGDRRAAPAPLRHAGCAVRGGFAIPNVVTVFVVTCGGGGRSGSGVGRSADSLGGCERQPRAVPVRACPVADGGSCLRGRRGDRRGGRP